MTRPAPVPRGLPAAGSALWRSVARQWADDGLEPDARERRWLEDACREAAILHVMEVKLEAAVESGDLIVKGSMGQPVANALISECRRSRAQIAALLGKLSLEEPPAVVPEISGGMTAAQAGRLGGFAKHYGRDGRS